MSSQDFTKYSAAFVKSYSAKGWIKVLQLLLRGEGAARNKAYKINT
jgi:hypothetical protein